MLRWSGLYVRWFNCGLGGSEAPGAGQYRTRRWSGLGGGRECGSVRGDNADRFNRQLHDNEKKAIADKASQDQVDPDKLIRAACYEMKCWAQYKSGSDDYNKNYVSQVEAAQLQPELDWVNSQKEAGLFDYTGFQKVCDAVQSDPLGVAKDAAKVVIGGVTVNTGVGLCTTGVGCLVGGWMAAFGSSDVVEGGSGLYNRYKGINSPGENPLRWGANQFPPIWGNTIYD
jgi:filamentous hemagglutinin